MKLRIMSDLHQDHWGYHSFSYRPGPDEILVLAGDVGELQAPGLVEATIRRLAAQFRRTLWVLGNHEYYGLDPTETLSRARGVESRIPGLTLLDNDIAEIDGVRFLGTTLWFPYSVEAVRYRNHINDFCQISDFDPWVYERHTQSRAFLRRNLDPGCVCISHHLPAAACVAPRWRRGHLNCYFVGDVGEMVSDLKPQLWVHGHGHDSVLSLINETVTVSNPRGYPGEHKPTRFNPDAVMEVHGNEHEEADGIG